MTQSNRSYAGVADGELVRLAQDGDDQAYSELVARHHKTCTRLAMSILRNREDAEDEVQNAIWNAYRNIERFQQEAQFSTWLTRIVVNQCLMNLRKKKRSRLLYTDDVTIGEEVATLELPDKRTTPEKTLADAQVRSALRTEINRIPPLLRNVCLLRDVEQRPMAEVAERLGISVAAAKSRLLRARKELRARMEKHTGRLGAGTLLAEA